MNKVFSRLKRIYSDKFRSQIEFAELLNEKPTRVSNVLNGKVEYLKVTELILMREAGFDLNYIFGENEESNTAQDYSVKYAADLTWKEKYFDTLEKYTLLLESQKD